MGLNDKQLLDAVRMHDETALRTLVDKYYPDILSYVCYKTNYHSEAYDITQNTFMKFFSHIDTYHENGKLKNYLLTIANREIVNWYRKEQRHHHQDIDMIQEASIQEARLNRNDLMYWIEKLPIEQGEVILLTYFHQLKGRDIAKLLGIPYPTMKSRLRVGLKQLKKLMKEGDQIESITEFHT